MGEWFEQHWITSDRCIISWCGNEHPGSRELSEEERELLIDYNTETERKTQKFLKNLVIG